MNRVYNRSMTDEVFRLLDDVGPMTCQELVRLTGRSGHSVRDSLRRLKDQVHVQAYIPSGSRGRRSPVYAVGKLPNAVEGSDTSKQRNDRYRKKMRQVIIARDAIRHGREVNMWRGLL